MKKFILCLILILTLICSGCSSYDAFSDTSAGITLYSADVPVDDSGNNDSVSEYGGTYKHIGELIQCSNVFVGYYGEDLAIVAVEKRYSCLILNVFSYSNTLLDNFVIGISLYDETGIAIGCYETEQQFLVGQMFNSIILNSPVEFSAYSVDYYYGDYVGCIQNVVTYDFDSDSVVRESNTTFQVRGIKNNLIFLTQDNRIVWGCKEVEPGLLVIGRDYVKKYGIVEVVE